MVVVHRLNGWLAMCCYVYRSRNLALINTSRRVVTDNEENFTGKYTDELRRKADDYCWFRLAAVHIFVLALYYRHKSLKRVLASIEGNRKRCAVSKSRQNKCI